MKIEDVNVELVKTTEELGSFTSAATEAFEVALDTETYGWENGGTPQLRVISAAMGNPGNERAFVIDCKNIDRKALAGALRGLRAVGWNANYDEPVLDAACGPLHLQWYDAMLVDAVCHQGEVGFDFYRGLAEVAAEKCGLVLEGKGTVQTSFDADSELTDEQVRYAALDAIATLRVAQVLRTHVDKEGLKRAVDLELQARPFLSLMERHGIPIAWDEWRAYIDNVDELLGDSLEKLAALTGGGQADIFSGKEKPLWKPDSPEDVKRALNEWAKVEVEAFFKTKEGKPRLLTRPDRVDKDTLREIGGELVETLLEYRDAKKIASTYGDNLAKWVGEDGRIRPKYLQVIGTDTGRLSSRNPNAQNLTPKLKPYLRPGAGRVFAYADLSQAELRDVAQESGDVTMTKVLREGRDIHVATAELMFSVDMEKTREENPETYDAMRKKGKTLNFGIVYGLGPAALGRSLTLSGVPTTTDEAKGLLSRYLEVYPGVAAWMGERDRFIRTLANNPPEVDLDATFALADMHPRVKAAVRAFKKTHGRNPDDGEVLDEIAPFGTVRRDLSEDLGREPTDQEVEAARVQLLDRIAWVRKFRAPVVLGAGGTPLGFVSKTASGRQRRFQLSVDSFLLSIAMIAAQSRKPGPIALRDAFALRHGVTLSRDGRAVPRDALVKVFEDRKLRREFCDWVLSQVPADARRWLAQKAAGDRISAMGNAYRNAPIQGGVADIVLDAYGRLAEQLRDHRDIWPVQTVHDSIVLECDEADGEKVARMLKTALEQAMAQACPDVPAVADADVRTSLSDGSVIQVIE